LSFYYSYVWSKSIFREINKFSFLKYLFFFSDEDDEVKTKLSKYFGDGESSGSDFEEELKKKEVKKMASPSSSEDDDEPR